MFDSGKITQKPVETIDGLNYTYEMIFANEESFTEFSTQDVSTENSNTRGSTFCIIKKNSQNMTKIRRVRFF